MKKTINPAEGSIPLPSVKNLGKKVLVFLIVTLVFQFILFPMPTLADQAVADAATSTQSGQSDTIALTTVQIDNQNIPAAPVVAQPEYQVVSTSIHTLTAYNSEVGQTDDSPCTTANGYNVCDHNTEDTIAANFLKMGTKVRIPDLFGDRVFVVRDRMAVRHANRIDVWMKNRDSAVKFGVKVAKIEVLE